MGVLDEKIEADIEHADRETLNEWVAMEKGHSSVGESNCPMCSKGSPPNYAGSLQVASRLLVELVETCGHVHIDSHLDDRIFVDPVCGVDGKAFEEEVYGGDLPEAITRTWLMARKKGAFSDDNEEG